MTGTLEIPLGWKQMSGHFGRDVKQIRKKDTYHCNVAIAVVKKNLSAMLLNPIPTMM